MLNAQNIINESGIGSVIESLIEEWMDGLTEVEVFYNYVDGEEGDTSKHHYFDFDKALLAIVENHGGDCITTTLTTAGKTRLFAYISVSIEEELLSNIAQGE